MYQVFSRVTACALAVAVSVQAQSPDSAQTSSYIKLRYATFDPVVAEAEVPEALQSRGSDRLWIVQFEGKPTQTGRNGVMELGGQIHGYLPDNAYVVRMGAGDANRIEGLPSVRWVGRYHAAYRLEDELVAEHLAGVDVPKRRYNMVVVDKHNDKPGLAVDLTALGGAIDNDHPGSILFTATLTGDQLLAVARLDQVLWIDRWTPDEEDVDNARIQGGVNYVEGIRGYTGNGLGAHIYEGIETSHPAYSGPVTNVRSGGASSGHGTNTAGIVFGDGTGNPQFRGCAPDSAKFYTNYSSVSTSRWQVVSDLVNIHNVSHTTASWGGARTFNYSSVSADADDIIFDHDIAWTQSQSNAGNQDSRPQAWAKNIFSIGGVRHQNNSNPLDDSWSNSGSTGPANDGRIKPTMAAYYDSIGTTSTGGGYTTGFGGTSGATPIIAGHNMIAIDMFTDEIAPGVNPFGTQLRNPGGSKHSNRPHFTTLKALQVTNTRQYSFNAGSTDNRREHVGYGFPNLQNMWDKRDRTFIVDETDVLTQGSSSRWDITVGANEAELRIAMHHAEPAGNPAAALHRVNDLSLRVTSPSGVVYWGNNGIEQGNWSVAGGSEDNTNPLECVFVQSPQPGVWNVDIFATLVVQDSHVETPQIDADYGLVVSGGTGQGGNPPVLASFVKYGAGCPGSVPAPPASCPSLNPLGGALTLDTRDNEYTNQVLNSGTLVVTGFDIWGASVSGIQTVPAHIYADQGGVPQATPLASTTVTFTTVQGFRTATFASPVTVTGNFYVGFESNNIGGGNTNQTVYCSILQSGTQGNAYWRDLASPNWTQSVLSDIQCYIVACQAPSTGFLTPALDNAGLPTVNSSYGVTLTDAVSNSAAIILTGFSDTIFNGTPLPAALPDAPGCNILAAPEVTSFTLTSASGSASSSFSIPNNNALTGFELFHQWAVLDPANTLGMVVTEGGKARVGN